MIRIFNETTRQKFTFVFTYFNCFVFYFHIPLLTSNDIRMTG